MIARYGKERSWIFEKVTLGIKIVLPSLETWKKKLG